MGAKFPEDAIEDAPVVERGTAAQGSRGWGREEGLDEGPLFVGEVHGIFE
jgi:hypothetical protein